MAKLYKTETYILDINDSYNDLHNIIDDADIGTEASFQPFNIQEVEFEWKDDIDLNYTNATIDTYRNYFK